MPLSGMGLWMVGVALAAASPSPEALALGRQLAESGSLAALLPLIQAKETEELVAANPELSAPEKAQLRAVAARTFAAGRERLMAATANAYAERLSVEDLRALVAFEKSPAAGRYRAAMPAAIAATMQAVGPMDFKGDVLEAFCKETGKLCGKR
jgi:hypothetical protein